jgi:hypothetical protein
MRARNRVVTGLSYRPTRLHRLKESIPGLLKSLKIRALIKGRWSGRGVDQEMGHKRVWGEGKCWESPQKRRGIVGGEGGMKGGGGEGGEEKAPKFASGSRMHSKHRFPVHVQAAAGQGCRVQKALKNKQRQEKWSWKWWRSFLTSPPVWGISGKFMYSCTLVTVHIYSLHSTDGKWQDIDQKITFTTVQKIISAQIYCIFSVLLLSSIPPPPLAYFWKFLGLYISCSSIFEILPSSVEDLDPESAVFWPLDLGSGMETNPDLWFGICDEHLVSYFW